MLRLVFVFLDMAIIGLILFQLRSMGRSAWWAVAYAWHPLAISEVAGSGHQDVIGIAFMLLSLVLAGRLVKTVEEENKTLSRKRLGASKEWMKTACGEVWSSRSLRAGEIAGSNPAGQIM